MRKIENLPEEFRNREVTKYYEIIKSKKATLFFKRLLDFVISVILFIILLPFNIVFALLVKCTSKGPILFKQIRVGKYGKTFNIYKFRTMVVDAEKLGAQITVGRDPRITSIGFFLRKFRLDELPQLINVIKGDMTLVGTRPEVPYYVDKYTDEMMATLLLRPGVTGSASLYFKDEAEMLEIEPDPEKCYVYHILPKKMKINLEYIEKMSVLTDFKIIIKTFLTEVTGG